MGDTMAIDPKQVDQLLSDYKKAEQIIGEKGLQKQLRKALLERAMKAELDEHLGLPQARSGRLYERQQPDEAEAEG